MCLYLTDTSKIERLNRDLIVYKVLANNIHSNSLKAPYYYAEYKLGKLSKVRTFSGENSTRESHFKTRIPRGVYSIDEGIHTFETLSMAKRNVFSGRVVVRCRIPKGTPIIREDGQVVTLALLPEKIVVRG